MIKKIKKNYFLLISTFLLIYFFFNLLDGERGLVSYFEKKNLEMKLSEKKVDLSNKLNELENENKLLSEKINLDYLDTLYRQKLKFGKRDEILIKLE